MTDIEISRNTDLLPITNIASRLGIKKEIEFYGNYKAKIDFTKIKKQKKSKLILVTAMSPTPYGEGKTTVSIGLADAMQQLNRNPILVLRQPSMGPVFGLKGGATGGGKSQVVPMEDINLHFTGDFHAVTSANNLLCAAIDNHLYSGNSLDIDPNSITFKRCLDVNDRALRNIEINLNNNKEFKRKESFQITAASEIMTILCLSVDMDDLKRRLDNILIGYNYNKKPIYAKDLHVSGSLAVLLKDAMKPNLVQTLEHTPTLIHGGPFANIAHGCNSIIATKTALKLADYVITEAGFGSDLGAEKFMDIKCRKANISPNVIVLVATIKALKYNSGVSKDEITKENVDAVEKGLCNLNIHLENMQKYNVPVIVCLNRFSTDTDNEISVVKNFCNKRKVLMATSTAYKDGGSGALDLAKNVIKEANTISQFRNLYDENLSIKEKISIIAHDIYRANNIEYSELALKQIDQINEINRDRLPICIAKTPISISDDAKLIGAPIGNTIHVKEVELYNGAEFITVLLGNILTMPGLPKQPAYESIYLDEKNDIQGIF